MNEQIPYGYCQCGCGQLAPIATRTHRRQGAVRGQPKRFIRHHSGRLLRNTPADVLARVASSSDDSECWEWTGPRNRDGYGCVKWHCRQTLVHRLIWEWNHGPIPAGLVVMHSCDNRACCNPSHLSLGTNQDNQADKVAKGRQAQGSGNGAAKLTEELVARIRAEYASSHGALSQSELGRRYGVSHRTIGLILHGRVWQATGKAQRVTIDE